MTDHDSEILSYTDLIETLAKKYCYNPNDYEDYVQEGYLVIMKMLNKIKDSSDLTPEIKRAKASVWLRNKYIDLNRKFIPEPCDDIFDSLCDEGDYDISLFELTDSLTDRQKKIINGVLEGLNVKEICTMLNISQATFYREFSKAKKEMENVISQ